MPQTVLVVCRISLNKSAFLRFWGSCCCLVFKQRCIFQHFKQQGAKLFLG